MGKIKTGDPIDLQTLSRAEAKVGDYKWSHLDETTFNDEHLGQWMLCNGQTAAGTTFQSLTGQANVPDATSQGTFLRQAKAGRGLGSFENEDVKPHNHDLGRDIYSGSSSGNGMAAGGGGMIVFGGGSGISYGTTNGQGEAMIKPNSGSENRPKNIALNLFVKVNY